MAQWVINLERRCCNSTLGRNSLINENYYFERSNAKYKKYKYKYILVEKLDVKRDACQEVTSMAQTANNSSASTKLGTKLVLLDMNIFLYILA